MLGAERQRSDVGATQSRVGTSCCCVVLTSSLECLLECQTFKGQSFRVQTTHYTILKYCYHTYLRIT
jgi:hypothetical protein